MLRFVNVIHIAPIVSIAIQWQNAAALLVINFDCPDIAEQVRRPGIAQLISIQWINAESRLSKMYCDAIKKAITEAKE